MDGEVIDRFVGCDGAIGVGVEGRRGEHGEDSVVVRGGELLALANILRQLGLRLSSGR